MKNDRWWIVLLLFPALVMSWVFLVLILLWG